MVARVSGRHMPEGRWQPCISGVTYVTVLRSAEMTGLFVIRVATGAATGHVLMIKTGRQPRNS
jgi:hypothetical protein